MIDNHSSNITTIIFDMDGTLIDSEPLWKSAVHEYFLELGINTLTDKITFDPVGLRINEIIAAYYQYYPWPNKSLQSVKQNIVDLAQHKIENQAKLLPGVIDALERCKQSGYQIGLASSSPINIIHAALKKFALHDYFSVIESGDTLVSAKPHPEIYLLTAHKFNAKPTSCLAIEDSLNGMIAAKAARFKTIVVPEKSDFNNPRWSLADTKLSSLTEFCSQHIN